jgi:hypothetical protein
MWMGVRGWALRIFVAEDAESLLHHEERSKSNEDSQPIPHDIRLCLERGLWNAPDDDVAFIVDHDDSHFMTLVVAHERMRDEVKEYIGEQSACLCAV